MAVTVEPSYVQRYCQFHVICPILHSKTYPMFEGTLHSNFTGVQ